MKKLLVLVLMLFTVTSALAFNNKQPMDNTVREEDDGIFEWHSVNRIYSM